MAKKPVAVQLSASLDETIDNTYEHFSTLFLGGIPCLLNADGAYLSFIAVFAGTEALAGFYAPNDGNGKRFVAFVKKFFAPEYAPLADDLWKLRNSLVHSFSPRGFNLVHHRSDTHLSKHPGNGRFILNAEDLYAALIAASRKYFDDLDADPSLKQNFAKRTNEEGTLKVGPPFTNATETVTLRP